MMHDVRSSPKSPVVLGERGVSGSRQAEVMPSDITPSQLRKKSPESNEERICDKYNHPYPYV